MLDPICLPKLNLYVHSALLCEWAYTLKPFTSYPTLTKENFKKTKLFQDYHLTDFRFMRTVACLGDSKIFVSFLLCPRKSLLCDLIEFFHFLSIPASFSNKRHVFPFLLTFIYHFCKVSMQISNTRPAIVKGEHYEIQQIHDLVQNVSICKRNRYFSH